MAAASTTRLIAPSVVAPAQARGLVADLALDRPTAEAVRLAVSELVSNAVLHGTGSIRVRLSLEPGSVRVSVGDDGAGFWSSGDVAMPPPEASGGRGLALVQKLSMSWGVERGEPTRVWCVIALAA